MTAEQIIRFFKMQPLRQEGGFYIETYRAAEQLKKEILPEGYSGDRNFSSTILYLLTAKTISLMHRLKSDEMFHFYLGSPVTMLQLHPDGRSPQRGRSEIITLGPNILDGQVVQALVPKGVWQGAFIQPGGKFALMGCSVAPAFDEQDFELGQRDALLAQYPDLRELILRLTRAR
jgi:predicted cupin superfamily sugar epimerase